MADTPPTNGDVVRKWIEQLKRGGSDWILAALVALFIAFGVEILQWTGRDGLAFRHSHGWLALFGLWLICYWAVVLLRGLLAGR
jgi:hypothetical protein